MDSGLLTDVLIQLILGLGIGFTIGMTGIGVVLVIPSLLYIVGLPEVSAIGTGLIYSMLARSYGVYEHLKLRTIRKRTAFYIILGGIPAVLATSFIIMHLAKTPVLFTIELKHQNDLNADRISEDLRREFEDNDILLSRNAAVSVKKKDNRWLIIDEKTYGIEKGKGVLEIHPGSRLGFVLRIIITVVMIMTWALMFMSLLKSHRGGSENYYVPPETFPFQRKLYGIAAGAGVGVLIGSTSIGGGILIVPILATAFQLSPNNTVGTSVLVGIIMSGVGSFAYLLGGSVNIAVAVTMFAGSIPGVYLGARVAVKIPHRILSVLLFIVITMSMIAMLAGLRR